MPIYKLDRAPIYVNEETEIADLYMENFILQGELAIEQINRSINSLNESSINIYLEGNFWDKVKEIFTNIKNFIVSAAQKMANAIKGLFGRGSGNAEKILNQEVPISDQEVEAAKKDGSPAAQKVVNNVKEAPPGEEKSKRITAKYKLEYALEKLKRGKISKDVLESKEFYMFNKSYNSLLYTNSDDTIILSYSHNSSVEGLNDLLIGACLTDGAFKHKSIEELQNGIKNTEKQIISKAIKKYEDISNDFKDIPEKFVSDENYTTTNFKNDFIEKCMGPKVHLDSSCAARISAYSNADSYSFTEVSAKRAMRFQQNIKKMAKENVAFIDEVEKGILDMQKDTESNSHKFDENFRIDSNNMNKVISLLTRSINKINGIYIAYARAISSSINSLQSNYSAMINFLIHLKSDSFLESANTKISSNIFEGIEFI